MRYVCPECGEPGDSGACATDKVARVPVGSDTLLGTTIGSWRVASVLGAGGMGRVYKAVQPAIGARVAIKVLRRECACDPELVERFFNEARSVNLIRHDNIVDVIDLGKLPDGAPYIVMEYLEGASLAALFKRARLALGTLAKLVAQVLAALEAAHAKGIVHRDLKPDNVYVSPGGRVTVLDFGIAKLVTADGTNPTQTGSLLGTPAYMSPEQARAQPLDARTDLYSVGVILYEGTTGVLPFVAGSLYEMLDLQVKAAPPPPRSKNAEIPKALEAVILRALAKDPAERFATAKELRIALADATQDLASEELVLPVAQASAGPPSDPFAATAASTQGSLARGETMPSSPPAVTPPVARSRRGAAFAAVAVAAALGGAAIALTRHHDAGTPEPAVTPVPVVPDAGTVVLTQRTLVAPDPVVTDAAVAPADTFVITPAMVKGIPRDAGARRADAAPAGPPRTLEDGGMVLTVTNPRAFDPGAYVKTATALATKQVGKVALVAVNWHGFGRNGLIDLTQPHASAQFQFVALDRNAANNEYCSLAVMFEDGQGIMSLGRISTGEPCGGRPITLSCSPSELWKRAEAQGLPAGASAIGANYISGFWHLSSRELPDFDAEVPDDCP